MRSASLVQSPRYVRGGVASAPRWRGASLPFSPTPSGCNPSAALPGPSFHYGLLRCSPPVPAGLAGSLLPPPATLAPVNGGWRKE